MSLTTPSSNISSWCNQINLRTKNNLKSVLACRIEVEKLFSVLFSSQQYISELYYNLSNSNQPDLLDLFEKHLGNVVKDIKAKAAENQRLEEALKR